MRITKRQLKRIIKEEVSHIVNEYRTGTHGPPSPVNGYPPKDSNWYEFSEALDIGILDLDHMAYELGFRDFAEMDISISPGSLAKRDSRKFVAAAKASSVMAQDMSDDEIIAWARPEGY
ncbi:MAG: hypothetical protein CME70_19250 [Halobacteriovorax sp.]|nr:hypothetical protein [Halobacteriovorax sp.]|tara:strand:+ start:1332 stop:1688 length:357 start_codon:yes stop_codon:yes gene_type:complete